MKRAKQKQEKNFTIEHTSHKERFEIITNYHLLDKRLTMAEKGFLTMLYILPTKWKITQRATAQYFNIDKNTFNNYIKKLVDFGYIEIKKTAKNKASYIIKERPTKADFEPSNIENYTIKQLNQFYNDARIEQRYKDLIKKAIEQAKETSEQFNKTLEEIEQETTEKNEIDKLPFEL